MAPSVHRPEFVPDASLSREDMERLQREIADAALFSDDLGVDPASLTVDRQVSLPERGSNGQTTLDDTEERQTTLDVDGEPTADDEAGGPLIAGVDQAFLDEAAVSAVVVIQNGRVVERAHAVEPVEIPYVPGLLSFREGQSIISALASLSREPDLLVVDGSGRIHFREAGLATHVGVTVDIPAVGVAKNLLCGRPRADLEGRHLEEGERVAIEADGDVTAADGSVIGYAVQTRQFSTGNRYVNPLYVSPGHRVGAETAADVVARCSAGYKLPEPTRLADSDADRLKRDL